MKIQIACSIQYSKPSAEGAPKKAHINLSMKEEPKFMHNLHTSLLIRGPALWSLRENQQLFKWMTNMLSVVTDYAECHTFMGIWWISN
jgi:hypothetical protein